MLSLAAARRVLRDWGLWSDRRSETVQGLCFEISFFVAGLLGVGLWGVRGTMLWLCLFILMAFVGKLPRQGIRSPSAQRWQARRSLRSLPKG